MALHGILPAIVTPINDNGDFDPNAFERLIARLYGAGVDGLYVCGQTGGGLRLRTEVRQAVLEVALRCSPPGKTVIAHIGTATTAEAIQLAQHAEAAGAHAISSLPPIGGYSFEETRLYYAALGKAVGIPLLIYYFPTISGGASPLAQILELCSLPGVAGMKFTDSDLFQMQQVKRHGHVIFNGSDEMLAAGLLMGADGGIGSTYNLIPEQYVALRDAAAAGNWEEARRIQYRVNEFIAALLKFPVLAGVKTLLRASGYDCGGCIPPRRNLTPAEESTLLQLISATELGSALLAPAAR